MVEIKSVHSCKKYHLQYQWCHPNLTIGKPTANNKDADRFVVLFGHISINIILNIHIWLFLFFKVYTVCGIYLGCACLAIVIVAIFLDKISHETDGRQMTTKQLLGAIGHHFYSSKYQQLLIPLTMYSGIESAFIAGDYTRVCWSNFSSFSRKYFDFSLLLKIFGTYYNVSIN